MSIYRSLADLLDSLQMAGAPPSWSESWASALVGFPGDGSKVDFLSDGYAVEADHLLLLTGPMLDDLQRALALVRSRLDLSLLVFWL